ncbi:hypothetical protein [Haloferax volcanii]|uniref:Uncharacterized protein n=3 Tax=Haloferax volcanii TaxID=2246 RepID=D4GQA7_HALVD|nr:hypothetical protein [Haloferax volcanii]ADE01686.1 uncharacterized protein HVO_A0076 [Haloferax volcanii DS2]ELY28637.1 hypothetical protein C498_10881 [Haloferax volcanii DS2]MBS8121099.1 hypothetical protein [Haloferax volcanii]MBS8126110.1 hypothetical protein [Haloferax volcanii]MBS8129964.1 hypothetical protein [Haloferax volcanii]
MTHSLAVEELVNATSEELGTYLRSGALNTNALTRSLDYEGLDIEDWERIKRIHFCLADDVHDFISALSDRVRRIKTEHQRENIHTQGEVRGSINWSATLRTRSESGYADRSRFVCNTPYTEYDIAENRVLKRLLWQIHRTVTDELQSVEYDWRQEFWTDDQLASFDRLYKQNVHLSRIKEGPAISVSGQDMTTARQSRLPLYTEAYDLYDMFQRLQADTLDADITELLADTLVVPTDTPTLFELFCCFRLIRTLTRFTPGFVLKPIDGESNALAHLESDDTRIEIHHDSTGSLSFHEPLDTTHRPVHAQYARYHDALIDYSDTLEALTGDPSDPVLYNGRPDIIIEIYDTTSDERLDSVLLGEIKHSDATQTFKQGLEELLTYRRFASKDNYLIDKPDITLTSLLITNGVTTSGTSDEVIHLNGTDLIDSPATHSKHLDWIHSLSGLPATPSRA